MLERYEMIVTYLSTRSNTYIHYKSLKNFIVHLDSIQDLEQKNIASDLILAYLTTIENKIDEIDRFSATHFFLDYVKPLGLIYTKLGFIKIVHLRFLLMLSIPFDIIIGILLFRFPYPLLSGLMFTKELIRRYRLGNSSKYYCMFH